MSISMEIIQSEFISLICEKATTLNLNVEVSHYETNSDYYWKNKGQFISVLNKGISDDKLKIIFQTHIQKVEKANTNNTNNTNKEEEKEEELYELIAQVKIVKTKKYSIYEKL